MYRRRAPDLWSSATKKMGCDGFLLSHATAYGQRGEAALDEDGELVTFKKQAYFMPENLMVEGRLLPEKRHRGIYEAVLYEANLSLKGNLFRVEVLDVG